MEHVCIVLCSIVDEMSGKNYNVNGNITSASHLLFLHMHFSTQLRIFWGMCFYKILMYDQSVLLQVLPSCDNDAWL